MNTETTPQNQVQVAGASRDGQRVQKKVEPTLSDIGSDIGQTFADYAKKRPDVVAMWSFGVGFVLAWKLKPW